MKVKLLIIPLVILLAVWIFIKMIIPQYDDLRQQFKDKGTAKQKFSGIQTKVQKVNLLYNSLDSNQDQATTLFKYLPDDKQESEIVDNLNYNANLESLMVTEISVTKTKTAGLPANFTPPANIDTKKIIPGGKESAVPEIISPEELKVTFNALGTYEQLKSFLAKVSKLERFDRLDLVKISRLKNNQAVANPSDKTEVSQMLQLETTLAFNYLMQDKNISEANFAEDKLKDKFDFGVIDEIKSRANTSLVELEVGQSGRSNPFIP
ncbi:MAG: hypothetical protein NTZ97_03140 [Candidatus Moranbacteria bacterium]|nr:hypothetical protein [Candidatus Moranbacteria bacterium]